MESPKLQKKPSAVLLAARFATKVMIDKRTQEHAEANEAERLERIAKTQVILARREAGRSALMRPKTVVWSVNQITGFRFTGFRGYVFADGGLS